MSELLGVSTTTIRTDLNQMDKDCLLKKTHGGAVYRDNNMERAELTGRAYYFDERALENKEEKEKIANEAVKLVKDHMCIFLDASSTAYVSARGFSVEDGLTDFSIYEADLKRMCIKASARTVALVDHTKFDSTSISSYATLDDINMVITDCGISGETKKIYESAGIELVIAE